MFCPHCGAATENGAAFCVKCGTRLQAPVTEQPPVAAPISATEQQPAEQAAPTVAVAPPPAPPSEPSVAYAPPTEASPSPLVNGEPPAVDLIRRLASSPLFFIAVICLTVSAVLSLITLFSTSGLVEVWADLLDEMADAEMEAFLNDFSWAFAGGWITAALIGMIPTVLIVIGLWMVYVSAKEHSRFLNLKGLALVKGAVVTQMVLFIVGLVITLLLCILVMLLGNLASGDLISEFFQIQGAGMTVVMVVMAIILVVLVVALVLGIIYYAKVLKSLASPIAVMHTGAPNSKVSVFVAVMCFISAVTSLNSLTSVIAGAALVMFGILLIQYRDRMRALESPLYP